MLLEMILERKEKEKKSMHTTHAGLLCQRSDPTLYHFVASVLLTLYLTTTRIISVYDFGAWLGPWQPDRQRGQVVVFYRVYLILEHKLCS